MLIPLTYFQLTNKDIQQDLMFHKMIVAIKQHKQISFPLTDLKLVKVVVKARVKSKQKVKVSRVPVQDQVQALVHQVR